MNHSKHEVTRQAESNKLHSIKHSDSVAWFPAQGSHAPALKDPHCFSCHRWWYCLPCQETHLSSWSSSKHVGKMYVIYHYRLTLPPQDYLHVAHSLTRHWGWMQRKNQKIQIRWQLPPPRNVAGSGGGTGGLSLQQGLLPVLGGRNPTPWVNQITDVASTGGCD